MSICRRTLLQSVAAASGAWALQPLFGQQPLRSVDARSTALRVVPALKDFAPAAGQFRLGGRAAIAFRGAGGRDTAGTLAADLNELLLRTLPVRPGGGATGDIELVLDRSLRHEPGGSRFDEEGYRIEIGSRVTITAPSPTGLYWGTRSLLQMFLAAPDRASLDRGTCIDWPDYPNRGFMLDVGRRFFTADFLRDYISLMSWFKLNEFQIHLMDNGFLEKGSLDWTKVQRGFRLASDNPKFAGLASADGAYDRRTWDALEDHAASRCVRIVPEIEGPAHALSVIGWKPELGLTGKNGDHLDLAKPEAFQTMKDIFTEFTPWFRGRDVHIGADEYKANPDLFVRYFNEISRHVRSLGKHPRAWGSFTVMSKGVVGYDKDVTINSWNRGWYSMSSAVADGYRFINTDDATLYVVPFAGYYHDSGLNDRELYENWVPSIAGKTEVAAAAPMGAMWAVWNDKTTLKYDELDVHTLAELTFPVIAQKTWAAAAPKISYDIFGEDVAAVGLGPARTRVKATRIGAKGDLMLDATVTAGASAPGYPAGSVNDREPSTRWRAATRTTARLDIDLGATARVARLEIAWEADARRLSYDVEASADGVRWTPVVARRDMTAGLDMVTLARPAVRYLRLTKIRTSAAPAGISRISAFTTAR